MSQIFQLAVAAAVGSGLLLSRKGPRRAALCRPRLNGGRACGLCGHSWAQCNRRSIHRLLAGNR